MENERNGEADGEKGRPLSTPYLPVGGRLDGCGPSGR